MKKIENIAGAKNRDVAQELRSFADFLEAQENPVLGWAVTTVTGHGSAGSIYGGEKGLALVGALEITKARIIEEATE